MSDDENKRARVELGRHLSGTAAAIGASVDERLVSLLGLAPDDPLPEVRAAPTSELATKIIGRFLETGHRVTKPETEELARNGALAFHGTSVTTLMKLYLVWRDVTLAEVRRASVELGTPEQVRVMAEEVIRASCDASLVRMIKTFDERRCQLEAMLTEERSRLTHQAQHDQLTGLLNRGTFLERVHLAGEAHEPDESIAVMYADLDGFKQVNDTYGHAVGDRVLRAIADRLAHALRPTDVAGRIGGDEFVVLCARLRGGVEAALAVADRLCSSLSEPLVVDGATIVCGASIGMVVTDRAGDPAALLAQADAALYEAKRQGKARVALG